jgi:hippurate hydrolase
VHDLHMTAWYGTAVRMAAERRHWKGTLMRGQPAEETFGGAHAMLDDGLFTRFPRPDCSLADVCGRPEGQKRTWAILLSESLS